MSVNAGSGPPPNPSKSRYATSCTECRRRKQKCSQGHPCTNCKARFPQTSCEYTSPAPKRRASVQTAARSPEIKVVVEGPAYSHLDLSDIQDAILLVEGENNQHAVAKKPSNVSRVSYSKKTPVPTLRSLPSPDGSEADNQERSDEPFKIVLRDNTGILRPQSIPALIRMILKVRLNVASRVVNDEWSINGTDLLRAAREALRPPLQMSTFDQQLHNLPMAPNRLNVELVRVYLQLLSRFKAAIDGNPDPESRFMKHWVPMSVKDPLLLHVVLYTSACFLNETGQVPKIVVLAHKSAVHKMINDQLDKTPSKLSDETVMGTAQMVVDSWYWGSTEEMQAHMKGLRTMVRVRGGAQALGLQGFLAKTVLIDDIAIALAHEIPTSMFGQPGFEFRDDFMMPHQVAFNSPLLFDFPPFSNSPTSKLNLHPLTSQILDDIRSLFKVVLSLPAEVSIEQMQQVTAYAAQTHQKLLRLPDYVRPSDIEYLQDQQQTQESQSDLVYALVRKVSMIYCRAIQSRSPTSAVCEPLEFLELWGITWQITLSKWRSILGIYVWVMIALVPSGHNTPPARFSKMLMVTAMLSLALDNWHLAVDTANNGLALQKWLGEGWKHVEKGVIGGEKGVEQYGFPVKEDLPSVATGNFGDETNILGKR